MESDTQNTNNLTEIIQEPVKEYLHRNEQKDSLSQGKIVDIATVVPNDPYENFEIDQRKLTSQSKRIVEKIASTNLYRDSLLILVELRSGEVFTDVFAYNDSIASEYPSVEMLAMNLDVDISSVHHLIGKEVSIKRGEYGWKIIEHVAGRPLPHTINRKHFLNPLAVSVLPVVLGVLIGVQTSVSILVSTLIGCVIGSIVLLALLYLTLASKREHIFAGVLGRISMPDYSEGYGKIEPDSKIVDVEHGEFKGIVTFADEEEQDSGRVVLYNLGVRMSVPPVGEIIVPVRSPGINWENSVFKRLVYSISPSVNELDRQEGKLIPIKIDGGHVKIDDSRLPVEKTNLNRSLGEKFADKYVGMINRVFDTPVREETYL